MIGKSVCAGLLVALAASGGAWAQEGEPAGGEKGGAGVSVGGGALLSADFGGGAAGDYRGGGASWRYYAKTPSTLGGAFAFFDTKYMEATLALLTGSVAVKQRFSYSAADGDSYDADAQDLSFSVLGVGFFIKAPFAITPSLTVFPLVGVGNYIGLAVRDEYGSAYTDMSGKDAPEDWSALWLRTGCGLDYNYRGALFLRAEVLYGVRTANKFEKDLSYYYNLITPAYYGADLGVSPRLGHGLTVRLAAGYRL